MHGYDANAELERRMVREWAAVSRPQVYYSLEKLSQAGLLRASKGESRSLGPERRVLETTASGREALADALERDDWTNQRDRPAFLTWVALSWQARPGVFESKVMQRRKFVEAALKRNEKTLRDVLDEVGHPFHEAIWITSFKVEQCRIELEWLKKVAREARRRGPARHSPEKEE